MVLRRAASQDLKPSGGMQQMRNFASSSSTAFKLYLQVGALDGVEGVKAVRCPNPLLRWSRLGVLQPEDMTKLRT
eukprot:87801-Rhodomonas_salina.1